MSGLWFAWSLLWSIAGPISFLMWCSYAYGWPRPRASDGTIILRQVGKPDHFTRAQAKRVTRKAKHDQAK